MLAERLISFSASAFSNLLLFAGVSLGWPQLGYGDYPLFASSPRAAIYEPIQFQPFIDNPDPYRNRSEPSPQCPEPRLGGASFVMGQAPLPDAFDPTAFPNDKMFACIRVGSGGDPLEVRLLGIDDHRLASALSARIRYSWAFLPIDGDGTQSGWLRVRLNRGPMDAWIRYPVYLR